MLKIGPGVEQYIKNNGNSVMILSGPVRGCCVGAAATAEIRLGTPGNLSRFEKNVIGDILVYVDKQFAADQTINILLAKLMWIKRLSVELA
jgi:hypothetical protein